MKNLHLLFILLVMFFAGIGCLKSKSCSPNTPASEASQMQAYALANGINATTHSSGLMYEIVDTGTGITASTNSRVYITYTGKLLDGTTFDQQTNSSLTGWRLSELIDGWKIGIPLIKEGGHIKLIIPSSMGYGCTGFGAIPGNTILFFDISLVTVVN